MNQIVNEKKFIESKLGLPYESLSQSYLRAETTLTTTSTIPFNLQSANVASPLVTEKLLNLNDVFVITHVAIGARYIGADSPTNLQQLNAQVYSYYDSNSFTTTNSANIATLWNSNLSWTINRKEYVPALSCRAFLRVPTTQTAANAYFTASGIKTTNGWDNGFTSFFPFEPTLISGRDTLNINVNLGTSVSFDDASASIYATMEVRGYLVVNAKS
jgi:hypothetical protein